MVWGLEWEDQPVGTRAGETLEMKDKKCPGHRGFMDGRGLSGGRCPQQAAGNVGSDLNSHR